MFGQINTLAKPLVLIISPALAKANNGNWQTAARWSHFLRDKYRVRCVASVENFSLIPRPDLIIALHARRSAAALNYFSQCASTVPRILVLTGTDLYRDIRTDAAAQHSLKLATKLVVLQPAGLAELDAQLQKKTRVIFQSAKTLKAVQRIPKTRRAFNVIMIGHLRPEKDPLTFLRACAALRDTPIVFSHIGSALDSDMIAHIAAATTATPNYRWLDNQPHAATRQRLKRSDIMVISSVMEGGANVIIEAITSGVPVLASDIAGNRGMLGDDYRGYFPVGDAERLAALIQRAATDADFLTDLQQQCSARQILFSPEREQASVRLLVDNCITQFSAC